MRLARDLAAGEHLVVEDDGHDWSRGGAVGQRSVVPTAALPQPRPVLARRQRGNEDQVGARQRLRSEGLAGRLSGRGPRGRQRGTGFPQSPTRLTQGIPGLVEEDGQERAGEQSEREGHVGLEGGGDEERGQCDAAHRRGQGAYLGGDPLGLGAVMHG